MSKTADTLSVKDKLVLKSAAIEACMDYVQELAEIESGLDQITMPPSEAFEEIGAAIRQEENALNRRRKLAVWAKRTSKASAAVLVTMVLSFSILYTSVRAFREQVLKFANKDYGKYSTITLGEKLEKPAGWPYEYYPTWIPQGFSLDLISPMENSADMWYRNGQEQFIFFSVEDLGGNYDINTEGLQEEVLEINGHTVSLYSSENVNHSYAVIVLETDVIFIDADVPGETMQMIIKNINNF